MKWYYGLFILLLLGSSCGSSSTDEFIDLDVRSMLEGTIVIKNRSTAPIIINTFEWEYVALSLEVRTRTGDTIFLPSPPTPPLDRTQYDRVLKAQEQLTIPLKGLEVLNEHEEPLQLRYRGYYYPESEQRKEVVSEWIYREAIGG